MPDHFVAIPSFIFVFMAWIKHGSDTGGRSVAGIAGSNPAEGMDVFRECRVLPCRGLCLGLIIRPQEYYRLYGCVSVIICNSNPLGLQ
jgi:hypothetical protein